MFRRWMTLLILALLLPAASATQAVAYAPYIWEAPWAPPNANPSQDERDVHDELARQISAFLDWTDQTSPPRPPGPFYVAQGYIAEDLYWLNPGETVLALSESLEFLPPALRDRLIAYLKYVMTSNAISPLTYRLQNNVAHPLMDRANYRNPYPALPAELARGAIDSSRVVEIDPPPENLYAAWAFAHYVSRYESPSSQPRAWDIIAGQWPAVDALYARAPAAPRIYWDVMAQVGYARMARQLGKAYAAAETRASAGYAAGLNFAAFYRNMKTSRWCEGNGSDQNWVGVWDYCLFSAIDPYSIYQESQSMRHNGYAGIVLENKASMFAPEIGRFLHDYVQNAVVNDPGYGLNRYLSPSGANYFPFWWENKGDKPWGLKDANTADPGNGENAIMHPSFAWQMFLLKAYVEGAGLVPARAGELKAYLDTPWARGDVFHIQKLVTTLRMYSSLVWTDIDLAAAGVSASPASARQNDELALSVSFVGSGRSTTVTNTLPVDLVYVSHAATCPGATAYQAATRQVTFSGTTPFGATCALTIRARVSTADTRAAADSAVVDNGIAGPRTVSATIILNGFDVFLPVTRRSY